MKRALFDGSPLQSVPLFPLPVVLFPGAYLPLQVFEIRYRRMVKECLSNASGFVIVQTVGNQDPDGFYSVGTYGEIFDWHPLPDQMIGIELKGLHKVRVHRHEVAAEDGLIIGAVEFLTEQRHEKVSPCYEALVQLLKSIRNHPLITMLPFDIDYSDACDVSFRLAEYLPFSAAEKQQMLEMDSAESRLEKVLSLLAELS